MRQQLPVSRRSPDLGEWTTQILEDLLINALRDREGAGPGPPGPSRTSTSRSWCRTPRRRSAISCGPSGGRACRGGSGDRRERNFHVMDTGGTRPFREETQVVDPRVTGPQDSYDPAKWTQFQREFEDLLSTGTTNRRIAEAAVRVFRIRVGNAERVTRGGTTARVQVQVDAASLARSAQEAARALVAPADQEWSDLARSSVGKLTAAEVPKLILHVHATAGRFAERHRGERVAELVYRLFPPALLCGTPCGHDLGSGRVDDSPAPGLRPATCPPADAPGRSGAGGSPAGTQPVSKAVYPCVAHRPAC